MAIPQELSDAIILKTQIINDLKNGIADGAGQAANQVGNYGFQAAMAEFTRLSFLALRKYVGE